MTGNAKAVWGSIVHLVAAAAVYRYLITGGWPTNHYRLDNLNIVNLGLAIFEPLPVLCVAAYWIWRTAFLGRLLWRLCLVQVVIGAGFLAFIAFFFFTWHPRMM